MQRSQAQLAAAARKVGQHPASLSATDLLQLQRTIGNQAVGRLLAQVQRRTAMPLVPDQETPLDDERLKRGQEPAPAGTSARERLLGRLPSAQRSAECGRALGMPVAVAGHGQPARIQRCGPSLNEVINQAKATAPAKLADQIEEASPEFGKLRGAANEEVEKTFGKGSKVEYLNKPKTGAGTGPAYYKEGKTYFDSSAAPPMTALNVIFETANAAQAGRFASVEADYESGALMKKPLSSYIEDIGMVGDLAEEAEHSAAAKRSLIQEVYEWNSFQLAKPALLEIEPRFTSKEARAWWEASFGEILGFGSFLEYYEAFGKTHRGAVQATLEQPKEKGGSSGGSDRMKSILDKMG